MLGSFTTFSTDKFQKMKESSPNGLKHYEKRRYCSLRAISPFPAVFSKDLNRRHVKTRA